MSEQDLQPVFSIEKIYVKDLSLEIPHAPQIFLGVSSRKSTCSWPPKASSWKTACLKP